jgi:probable poly-beta-1,6-N-acetyl-D-glucosamine export protein
MSGRSMEITRILRRQPEPVYDPRTPSAGAAPDPAGAGTQLQALHVFRVVAMVFVVAQHSVWAGEWPPGSTTREVLADLLDNSTVLFVFLSGYLFHHVAGRRGYREFLTRRVTRVLVPYLVVAFPAAVLAAVSPRAAGDFTGPAGEPFPVKVGWYLLHGATQVNIALWFVPMIMLFYLLAPVFRLVARHPRLYWALVVLVPMSLLAHRPSITPDVDTLALAVYFAPVYLAGMCASHHRERLQPLLRRHWAEPVLAFLVVLIAQVLLAEHHGNYRGAALFTQEHGLIDWLLAQKLLLCVAVLAVAERIAHRGGFLRKIGDASFSVFLVHCYAVNAVKITASFLGMDLGSLAEWIATTLIALVSSLLVVRAAWAVLGRRSVYVIGSAPVS